MFNKPWQRILLFAALVFAFNTIYFMAYPPEGPTPVADIAYSRFKTDVANDLVAEVTIEGESLQGKFAAEQQLSADELDDGRFEGQQPFTQFRTTLPSVDDPGLLPLLEAHKVKVITRPVPTPGFWSNLLVVLLPWVLIIGIWWFMFRRLRQQGGMGLDQMRRFSQSGAKTYIRETTHVTFDDVAGLAEAKQELAEIIDFLRDPAKFARLGGKVPRGVLLVGPPGTGKTLLARAVAGEAEVPFFSLSASQFIEMFVGVGASRVRDLFTNAKKNAPSIIFIDELDAVGRARGTGLGGGNDEREQTLNQLLSELDGFEAHDEVIVMTATNRPDVLDAALLRPGRFDRQVVVERPDWRDRVKILQVHTRDMPLADDVDLEVVARSTPGMVGADLQGLVNEAALIAARVDAEQVAMRHLEQAKDRQIMGIERKLVMTEAEKRITAIHEAGHTLVAHCLPNTDPLHKVTIIPRGQALGMTQQLPEDDRYHYQRSYLIGRLAVSLGGRVAEKLCCGEHSTGAQNDLKQVMDLAEKMVCQWGMSERLGPMHYSRGEEHPFLGRKLAGEKTFSEQTAWMIDQEIESLVALAEGCAEAIIGQNRKTLQVLADQLLAEETLDNERIAAIFTSHPPTLPEKACAAACGPPAEGDDAPDRP